MSFDPKRKRTTAGDMGPVAKPPNLRLVDVMKLSKATRELLRRTRHTVISHNSRCPCGSGKRFKNCHMNEG